MSSSRESIGHEIVGHRTFAPGGQGELILGFAQVGGLGSRALGLVGGKGMNLGALVAAGMAVPPGFCVTTRAFSAFVAGDATYQALLDGLDTAPVPGAASLQDVVRERSEALRAHLVQKPVPAEIAGAIARALGEHGADDSFAVRSSATAEDLPGASFAGQQDTYLEIRGVEAIIDRVRACWASLYTERAVLYRMQKRISHRDVALAVVVQKMVHAERSGILFTADPVSGDRRVMAIDAGFGLGEALVSGLLSADLYKVDRDSGEIIETTIGDKALAIRPAAEGGTITETLAPEVARARVLDDREVAALGEAGRAIEALQGCPQDIEWCIAGGEIAIVQARPITSLYPLPEPGSGAGAVHVCLNHFQVMTDAMSPLGVSLWQYFMPVGKSVGDAGPSPWMHAAGGRMFLDAAEVLRNPVLRRFLLKMLGNADRITQATLVDACERGLIGPGPRAGTAGFVGALLPKLGEVLGWLLWRDVSAMAERAGAELDRLTRDMRTRILGRDTALDRMHAAQGVLGGLFWHMWHFLPVVAAGLMSGHLAGRLAGAGPDELSAIGRGLSGNVTTDMDLAVGDLADVARVCPDVAAWIVSGADGGADALQAIPDAGPFVVALAEFIDRYGMRGPSEIDVGRPRWRDDVSSILKVVAGNLAHGEAGAHRAHHAALARRAAEVSAELEARARQRGGISGRLRGLLVRRLIHVHRELAAVREHPKFFLVRVLDAVRTAALGAGAELCAAGHLDAADDIFFLTLNEIMFALEHGQDVRPLAGARKAEQARFAELTPPRVMTGNGRVLIAHPERGDVPAGALVGTAASAGQVEGTARVIRDPATQVLHKGEILVAPFTDPGWTPLFINAAGLVMEVGGLMTHGSVVAREYGIPAVVCVSRATERIRTGQRIRVHGDLGYVEIMDSEDAEGGSSGGEDPGGEATTEKAAAPEH